MTRAADTIAAIATPPGEGGIAVVRVSGERAESIGTLVLRTRTGEAVRLAPRCVRVVRAVDPESGRLLDEVVALWMPGPASYTREDVLELQCHGGGAAARGVLESVLRAGARPAEPGEFTLRAYLGGRLDLVQAEAVLDVIRARTDEALKVQEQLLAGDLSRSVEGWQERLGTVLTELEVQLDFEEEEDVGAWDPDSAVEALRGLREEFGKRLATYSWGRSVREGFCVALLGAPNTGKSSLLNALLEEDRAIVSSTPGTTRDSIDAWVNACGVPVRVVDTAGIRDAGDAVEALGVERARRAAGEADLVVFVADGSRELTDWEEREAREWCGRSEVLPLVNKEDLGLKCRDRLGALAGRGALPVSAKTGFGIPELLHEIRELARRGPKGPADEVPLTRARHRQAIEDAARCLDAALDLLAGHGPYIEVAASELHAARRHLSALLGWGTPEDVLDTIFAEFCIGK